MLFACDKWLIRFWHVLGDVLNVTLNNKKLRGGTFGFGYAIPRFLFHHVIHWCGICPVHCRMVGSVPGLHPLDASSDILPCCDNHKCLHTSPNVTPYWGVGGGGKSPLVENHCSTPISLFDREMTFYYIQRLSQCSWYLYINLSSLKRDKDIFNLFIANIFAISKINPKLLK